MKVLIWLPFIPSASTATSISLENRSISLYPFDNEKLLSIIVEYHTILKLLVEKTVFVKPTLYIVMGFSVSLKLRDFSSPYNSSMIAPAMALVIGLYFIASLIIKSRLFSSRDLMISLILLYELSGVESGIRLILLIESSNWSKGILLFVIRLACWTNRIGRYGKNPRFVLLPLTVAYNTFRIIIRCKDTNLSCF